MEPTPSPHDKEIIDLLESLESLKVEYPPELLAARRAAFIAKAKQYNRGEIEQAEPSGRKFTKRLRELQPIRAEYPADLLAARRAAFIAQIEQQSVTEVAEELTPQDQELLKLFKSIKAAEADYPPRMLAVRRSAFLRHMALGGPFSILEALRTSLQHLMARKITMPSLPMPNVMRMSAVIAVLMLAAFVGSLLGSREQVMRPPSDQAGGVQPVPVIATDTLPAATAICKPGYQPPLCLAREFEPEQDLTSPGNGVAREAVAKDTVPGYRGIHDPDYLNDGLYGPGSSWVSNSAYSWIKIDLGTTTTINTVAFGRDRLGHLTDGNPGQFVIAVALSDNIYADGNSSNDYIEYTQVYDSSQDGFSGVIAGPQTIRAAFGPVTARFVKIIFTNVGTTVDEVEVFMIQPPVLAEKPTRKPKDDETFVPATPVPSLTLRPTNTASPVPTDTLFPTDTATPSPTNTPLPTDTPTDRPTATNTLQPTRTPTPIPTDTPAPTSTPQPTQTRVPTDTPVPLPTDTETPALWLTESSALPDIP